MWRLLVMFILLGSSAWAGAWPQQKGGVFVSSAARLGFPDSQTGEYYTLYLEYGASERVTLGIDLGSSISGHGKALGFGRISLGAADRRTQWALELGVGKIAGQAVIRPGLSWGRSVNTGLGSGWIGVDTLLELGLATAKADLKADITFGVNRPNDQIWMLQFQTGQSGLDPAFMRIAPSVAWSRPNGKTILLGIEAGVIADTSRRIKFEFWHKF